MASLLLLLCGPLTPRASAQPAQWWDDAWKYRMKVRLGAGGAGAAQCQFPIPQGCAANGADVRVVDAKGQPCLMRLMYFQPGLYGIVAFQPNGAPYYWIYLGNPQAAQPAAGIGVGVMPGQGWEPRAGIFLETRRYTGGDTSNPRALRDAAAGTYSFGAGFRDQIYEGINPFGEPDKYFSLYEAWLNAPADGEYLFATVSKDASFMLIDGRPVAQWPGAHAAEGGARAQHNGKLRLTRGVHKMEYLHCDFGGERQCVVAAWMPPGLRAPRVMTVADFVSITPGVADALEEHGVPLTPDFRCAQIARLIAPGYTCTAWQLINCTAPAPGAALADCRWQFSDGTLYAGGTVNKVFFTTGDFTVTQTVRDAQGRTASATRPFRVHAVATPKPPEDERMMAYFADVAARMPAGMLNLENAQVAARLMCDGGRGDEAARAWLEAIERQWKSAKKVDVDAVEQVIALYRGKLRRPMEAEALLRAQLARAGERGPVRARLLLQLGRLQLEQLNQAGSAVATLRGARLLVESDPDTALRRGVLVALGNACLATAAAGEALEAYEAAEKLTGAAETKKYDRSSFALATEAYLREGRLEEAAAELERWTELYPTDKITGYATILESRLLQGQRNVAGAAAKLEEFLKCKPLGVFAQTALERLGDLYRELNRPADARQAYQRVLDEFQDEAVQSRVKNKLGEMK